MRSRGPAPLVAAAFLISALAVIAIQPAVAADAPCDTTTEVAFFAGEASLPAPDPSMDTIVVDNGGEGDDATKCDPSNDPAIVFKDGSGSETSLDSPPACITVDLNGLAVDGQDITVGAPGGNGDCDGLQQPTVERASGAAGNVASGEFSTIYFDFSPDGRGPEDLQIIFQKDGQETDIATGGTANGVNEVFVHIPGVDDFTLPDDVADVPAPDSFVAQIDIPNLNAVDGIAAMGLPVLNSNFFVKVFTKSGGTWNAANTGTYRLVLQVDCGALHDTPAYTLVLDDFFACAGGADVTTQTKGYTFNAATAGNTIPIPRADLEELLAGLPVTALHIWVENQAGTQPSNFAVPTQALITSTLYDQADLVDEERWHPVLLVGATAEPDQFVAHISLPTQVGDIASLPVIDGNAPAAFSVIVYTIQGGEFKAAPSGSYNLVLQVDCGPLKDVVEAAVPGAECAGQGLDGSNDVSTLTKTYGFAAQAAGTTINVPAADFAYLLNEFPAAGIHVFVEASNPYRQSNYALPTDVILSLGEDPTLSAKDSAADVVDLLDGFLWHPVLLVGAVEPPVDVPSGDGFYAEFDIEGGVLMLPDLPDAYVLKDITGPFSVLVRPWVREGTWERYEGDLLLYIERECAPLGNDAGELLTPSGPCENAGDGAASDFAVFAAPMTFAPGTDPYYWVTVDPATIPDEFFVQGMFTFSKVFVNTVIDGEAVGANYNAVTDQTWAPKDANCIANPGPCNTFHDALDTIATGRFTPVVLRLTEGGLSFSGADSLQVFEGGATDTYQLRLRTRPIGTVDVAIIPDADTTVSPATVQFNSLNFDTLQLVTVTAVDDAFQEGTHTSTIRHHSSSVDPAYDDMELESATATVLDNDIVGITVNLLGGVAVSESTPTIGDTYTIRLNSAPTAPVVITVSADAQVTRSPSTLTFTALNYQLPKTVTIKAVDDGATEASPHNGVISHTISTADAAYQALTIANVIAAVTDNDATDVIFDAGTGVSVEEDGTPASDSYTVKLGAQPTQDVDIIIANTDGQVTATSTTDIDAGAGLTLRFTSANYNTAQTVDVAAVDDDIDEAASHMGALTHTISSTDPVFGILGVPNMPVTVLDDDTSAVTIAQTGGTTEVTEGTGSDTYTVVLDTKPSASVTVNIDAGGQLDSAPISLTFTPDDNPSGTLWSTPRTVTVTAENDLVDEGTLHTGTILHSATSTDPLYQAIAIANVVAQITDNDVAGVTLHLNDDDNDVIVTEQGPGQDSYTVSLDSQPAEEVVLTLTTGPDITSTQTLRFTLDNVPPGSIWNAVHTVTVTAVDDAQIEPTEVVSVAHAATSEDLFYHQIDVDDAPVTVIDNDVAIVRTPVPAGFPLAEATPGNAGFVDVTLFKQPFGVVVVEFAPDAQMTIAANTPEQDTDADASTVTFVFNTNDWNQPKRLKVNPVDDEIAEATPHLGMLSTVYTSSDPFFVLLALPRQPIPPLPIAINDNDAAGVIVAESGGTQVVEGGATDTYTLKLSSEPTSAVVIAVTDGVEVNVDKHAVTFTPENWDILQTVTVSAQDDAVEDGTQNSAILHTASSADPFYQSPPLVVASVIAAALDNDGIPVIESGGITAVTEGSAVADTYTINLASVPGGNVDVTVSPDGQLTVSSATDIDPGAAVVLRFTTTNYATPQTVSVLAVDDLVDELTPHPGTIQHLAAGYSINSVIAAITDNDFPTPIFTPAIVTGLQESLNAGEPVVRTYTIKLPQEPEGDVDVTLHPDAQITVSADTDIDEEDPVTLRFTPDNFAAEQTVEIIAVDDAVPELPIHDGLIGHTSVSTDFNFNNVPIPSVTARITDNDIVGLIESGGDTIVFENGADDTYQVALNSAPTSPVVVQVSVDAAHQADLLLTTADESGTTVFLTFTTANYNTPQTVTIDAPNDNLEEGVEVARLIHEASSAQPQFNDIDIPDLLVDIIDDDVPQLVFNLGDGVAVDEDAAPNTDTYTVALSKQPVGPVRILLTFDAVQLGVTTTPVNGQVTFTAANFATPQTVTVTAKGLNEGDDRIDETSPHFSLIRHHVDSQPVGEESPVDPAYTSLPDVFVSVTITDDDTAGIVITQPAGTFVNEQGATTDTYTVRLASQPSNDVTITLGPSPPGQLVVSSASDVDAGPGVQLRFTSANFLTPQTVTVQAVDDGVDEVALHFATITHVAASTDPLYNAMSGETVNVGITDNDVAGVTFATSPVNVAEGGAAVAYTVKLDSQPAAAVTITATSAELAQVTITDGAGASELDGTVRLTFTNANWNVPQQVKVTAVDDGLVEANHQRLITHVASGDPVYAALSLGAVTARIADNDGIIQSATQLAATEGGATASYTLVLSTLPTADVDIVVAGSEDVAASSATDIDPGAGVKLRFTSLNYNVPQTVTATAVNDLIDEESPETTAITHVVTQSGTQGYNGYPVAPVAVDITDNDVAGLTVNPLAVTVTENEDEIGTTYSIVLHTEPQFPVVVTLDAQNAQGQYRIIPAVDVTFTAADWNVPHLVTVEPIDDVVPEPIAHEGTIVHAAMSEDGFYDGMPVPDVAVTVNDNDVPSAPTPVAHLKVTDAAVTTPGAPDGILGDSCGGSIVLMVALVGPPEVVEPTLGPADPLSAQCVELAVDPDGSGTAAEPTRVAVALPVGFPSDALTIRLTDGTTTGVIDPRFPVGSGCGGSTLASLSLPTADSDAIGAFLMDASAAIAGQDVTCIEVLINDADPNTPAGAAVSTNVDPFLALCDPAQPVAVCMIPPDGILSSRIPGAPFGIRIRIGTEFVDL